MAEDRLLEEVALRSADVISLEQQRLALGPFVRSGLQDVRMRATAGGTAPRVARPSGSLDAFRTICERWELDEIAQRNLLGFDDDAAQGAIVLQGTKALSKDTKERISYVLAIAVGLQTLFPDSLDRQLAWLNSPRSEIENAAPLAFMLRGRIQHIYVISDLLRNDRGV